MATNLVTYPALVRKSVVSDACVSAAKTLEGRSLCGLAELKPVEVRGILDLAHQVKAHPQRWQNALARRQMVLFFEKPSLRTRLTFEVAINTLGGNAIFVDQTQSPLGERESLADVAHNVERWMDVCVLRTFAHETVTKMAEYARVPVINALSEVEHPCQALADVQTLEEHFGTVAGRRITFVGDANNVSNSLMLAAAHTGMHYTLASPEGYSPDAALWSRAEELCEMTGASVRVTHDLDEGVAGAAAIYTDTWVSMGHENEARERETAFAPFQVNDGVMAKAAPGAVFMHCLPANRNMEVTDSVIDSAASVVFDQAENRLHAQKAVLLMLLGTTIGASAKARPFAMKRGATHEK